MKKIRATIHVFLAKYGHWIFVALAAAVIMARLIPATVLHLVDSDNIQVPLLWQDLFVNGSHLQDWNWGGHSDLLPDETVGFTVRFLVRNGLLSLQISACVMFVLLLLAIIPLYSQYAARNVGLFTAGMLLLIVGFLTNFGIHRGVNISDMYLNNTHAGTQIMSLACLALAQRANARGYGISFWLLSLVCILTTASDVLFLTIFTIPYLATLVVARLLYPAQIRLLIPTVCNLLGSTVLGLLGARHLFPAQIAAGNYVRIQPSSALSSLHELYNACAISEGGIFVILLGLDIALVVFAGYVTVVNARRDETKAMPAMTFVLILFCACMILCNWGAALFTGNYNGISSTRYIRLSLATPVYLALGYFSQRIMRKNIARYAALVISVAAATCGFFLLPAPGSYYTEAQKLLPVIRAVMQQEKIESGLAEYWHANILTFLSDDTVRLRSITSDGSLYFWISNIAWFTGERSSTTRPEFRMIFMANLDPLKIKQCYGEPARIIRTPGEADIWIYPPERKITFSNITGNLTNDPSSRREGHYTVPASSLPSKNGKPDGDALVAVEGRDREDYLSYGPYIHPQPGHYRVKITYSYTAKPAPGKEIHCDIVLWNPAGTVTLLAEADVPFVDTGRHDFARDIFIPDGAGRTLEVRTFYRGSGGIRLESLDIADKER